MDSPSKRQRTHSNRLAASDDEAISREVTLIDVLERGPPSLGSQLAELLWDSERGKTASNGLGGVFRNRSVALGFPELLRTSAAAQAPVILSMLEQRSLLTVAGDTS